MIMMTFLMNSIILKMTIISSLSLIKLNYYSMDGGQLLLVKASADSDTVVSEASSSSPLSLLFEEVESLLSLSSSTSSSSDNDNDNNHDGTTGGVDNIINTIHELNQQYATIYTLLRQEHIHINEWNIQQLTTLLNKLDQYHTKYNNNKKDESANAEVVNVNDNNNMNSDELITTNEYNHDDMMKEMQHELYQDLYNEMLMIMKSSLSLDDDNDDDNNTSYIHRVIDNVVQKSSSIMNTILHHQNNDNIQHYDNNNMNDNDCVASTINDDDVSSINDAYHMIYGTIQTYNHDRIGIDDILQHKDTSIVYEMTSPTYESTMTTTSDTTTTTITTTTTMEAMTTLWKQYVPYDWEHYILPEGYEQMIYQTHTFIRYWCDMIYETIFTGVSHSQVIHSPTKKVKNANPNIILSNNTNLGYCWPMTGTVGYVTIRLPYPTYITNITLDHTSPLDNKVSLSSALKHFHIYTYTTTTSSSSSDDISNNGLGFDMNSKQLWKQTNPKQPFLYNNNVTSSKSNIINSIQTFTPYDDDDNDSESTSAAGAKVAATAIQVEILDNWGNPDYTCTYRIRVHGIPA